MAPSSSSRLAVLLYAALTLIWGTTWAAIRIGLEGIPPLTGAALRFGVASVALMAVAWSRGISLGGSPLERRLWLVNGLFSFVVAYGLVYWSEQYISSGLAAVLFATFTLWVGILSHLYLPGERLTARGTVGILVGFGGVAVLFSEDLTSLGGPGALRAAILVLLAPLSAAVSNTVVKRWGREVHPLSLTAVPMGMTCAVLGALALVFERHRLVRLDAASVGSVLYLGIFGTAVAFTLYYWLLARMPATRLALITYLTPVTAVVVGSLLLEEPFTLRMFLGSAAVLGGVLLFVRTRPRAWRRPRPPRAAP